MTYCKYCDREVQGTKPINWGSVILWFIITIPFAGILGLIIYFTWRDLFGKEHCPLCKMELTK